LSGPNIQFPFTKDIPTPLVPLLSSLQITAVASTRNGSSSARPTEEMLGRYIGMPFFDLTLGKPVFLLSTNPDIWVDAAGVPV
jgi:hypothetical protein